MGLRIDLLALAAVAFAGCGAPAQSAPPRAVEPVEETGAGRDGARQGRALPPETVGWVAPDGTRPVLGAHAVDQLAPGSAAERTEDLQCIHDADCIEGPSGICQQTMSMGGAAMPPRARCIYDACGGDGDCGAGELCVPAGYMGLPRAGCVVARCRGNDECTAAAGGRCRVLLRWTGSPSDVFAPQLIAACLYAGAACDADRACPGHAQCLFYEETGVPVCEEVTPVP